MRSLFGRKYRIHILFKSLGLHLLSRLNEIDEKHVSDPKAAQEVFLLKHLEEFSMIFFQHKFLKATTRVT